MKSFFGGFIGGLIATILSLVLLATIGQNLAVQFVSSGFEATDKKIEELGTSVLELKTDLEKAVSDMSAKNEEEITTENDTTTGAIDESEKVIR